MKNLKVSSKLFVSFIIVIALAIVVGVVGIFGMGQLNSATTEMYNSNIKAIDSMAGFRESYQLQRNNLRAVIMEEGNISGIQNLHTELESLEQTVSEAMEAYENTITDESVENEYFEAKDLYLNEYNDVKNGVYDAALAGNNDLAKSWLSDGASVAERISDGLNASALQNGEWASLANADSDELYSNLFMVLVGVLVATVIISCLLALYISSLIAKPLNMIKNAALEIAKGNINVHTDYKSKDEIGSLAEAFGSVIGSLGILIDSMKQLGDWATQGRIMERVKDDGRLEGAFKDVVGGVNGIMDTFGNHFNAIPVGVSIIDTGKNKLFENKTALDHKSISDDNLQTQTSDFADDTGRTIGSLVITVDQTTVMEAQRESERQAENVAAQMALAQKQSEYQKMGIGVIVGSVKKLAQGDLNIKLNDAPYDDDTKEIHDNFYELESNLVNSCATIRSYIDELSEVLASLSNKNLDTCITREYLGDFAALKESINSIADNMNEVFGEISGATNQVQNGSQQVANSSQSLAQGASEQASAVEQISSTIAEIASQTKSNAENATKANEISMAAKTDAETGSHQMDEMVGAMEAIKEASKGIASIIKVIEDIAFQTNILALNAAVEAARAGEHGKGFAVVAEEVRTLAARSATAAKETTDMIDNSLARVEVGSKIASDTAAALAKIVEGVTGTVDIVATIAEASAQQATAIAQIDNGIEQISKVTQSNTATAEESASASEEMAGQAQMLQQMVGEFNLRGQKSIKGNSSSTKSIPAPSPKAAEGDISISLDDDFDGDFGKY